jgi:hypothetical protein
VLYSELDSAGSEPSLMAGYGVSGIGHSCFIARELVQNCPTLSPECTMANTS